MVGWPEPLVGVDRGLLIRFCSFIVMEPNTGCWLWYGGLRARYGSISVRGRTESAHRVAYELFKGSIPNELVVCHTCDTRPCCNPDHLFLGTNKDNFHDMRRKGRVRGALKVGG